MQLSQLKISFQSQKIVSIAPQPLCIYLVTVLINWFPTDPIGQLSDFLLSPHPYQVLLALVDPKPTHPTPSDPIFQVCFLTVFGFELRFQLVMVL